MWPVRHHTRYVTDPTPHMHFVVGPTPHTLCDRSEGRPNEILTLQLRNQLRNRFLDTDDKIGFKVTSVCKYEQWLRKAMSI